MSSEAKKRLDHYRSTNINSHLKLEKLAEKKLLEIAERALNLPGDWKIQFEQLLMETEICC